MREHWSRILACTLATAMLLALGGCVNQHPGNTASASGNAEGEQQERRIVATSHSAVVICDRLGLDLIAVPAVGGALPERYQGLPEVGTAMAPDTEAIALLDPTDVIGPGALAETIEPAYRAAGIPHTFLDLQSVGGMYDSIAALGERYGAQEQADAMIAEYEATMADFRAATASGERPRVLVLMGLPGAYIECTQNSYVGSLIELAGAENVVQVTTVENFVSWNTEELLALDPDVILLTAHGMPDLAMQMFAEEFSTNDIWRHFRAVEQGQIYQLDHSLFGMSCTFEWPQALGALHQILYDGAYETFDAEVAALEYGT